jgi:hypothetical protein
MKYKHFRALVIVGVLVVGGVALRACSRWLGTEGAAIPSDPTALRPIDLRILERVKSGVSSDKIKDAFPGEPTKVNLYNEAGKVRVKLDLDRDDRWDEKWDFESEDGNEVVKRRVSTADDDATYDVEYRLREGRWLPK